MRPFYPLILALGLALPLPAGAQTDPQALSTATQPATLTVTGTGTVEAAPDLATLTIGVTTQGATASDALAANSDVLTAVMARLTTAGIEARDMQTSNLSVSPNWTGYDSATPTISGYVAINTLTIRVRQMDGLGPVVDAAVSEGANTLNGLYFGLSDQEPVLNDARKLAVRDARARAEFLATAAGVTLGRVLSISEGGTGFDPMPAYRAEAASVPVAEGEIGLSASVTMVFEITE
ncbi:MAG: hypothetical protein B7Z10_09940 [Rhodobacterales bacterium 32-66-7]|nr:MAG: hypothetical protein B7Z10_09940 [Rhodobacterales bacterium 32-66-7]OZA11631.1 MAG: hypothetical protein B7Y02_08500 [Rhodobacterales bacterium 17-64-5]